MLNRKNRLRWAVGAMSITSICTFARAQEPTRDDLLQQLKDLQAKVEKLETSQQSTAERLNGRDVDATIARVRADAEQRSQLLQTSGNFTAGYNKGKFVLQDEQGAFLLHPWIQFQPRWAGNLRENAKNVDNHDFESGFEIRRLKFGIDGNAFSTDLTYLFLWATDRNTGSLNLEEAWFKYAFGGQFFIKGGQFKDPFAHESLVSSKKLLAADRTLLTDNFTGGDNFVQGVDLGWDDGPEGLPLRAEVAYTDGSNGANQNFQDFPTNKANLGVAARLEYLAFGKWSQYDDFSALGNDMDMLVFGAGVDLTEAGNTDVFLHTVDAQYETGPLGLYAAFYGRSTEDARIGTGAAATDVNLYDWGYIAQASYTIDEHWEPFGRYSFVRFDADGLAAGSENEVHEITAGVNYFFKGHNAKFTLDLTYLPNGTPVADSGADILQSNGEAEYIVRGQFQLLL